jgi:uncharacterized membrane protein YidH (DUF202 family)
MDENTFRERIAAVLNDIHLQLVRSVNIQEEGSEIDRSIRDLEKKHAEAASGLLESTELATIRTELSRERSSLAGQRTDLAVLRTDFSRSRTSLADQRTKMAGNRTRLSEKRTQLAGTRTVFSNMRTVLAQGRTYLALVRTGLTFLTLSIALFRMFGLSWWSAFDGVLALVSLAMTAIGLTGYWHSVRIVRALEGKVPAEEAAVA